MKYTEQSAIDTISRNGGSVSEMLKLVNPPRQCGIKVWGAIDFLTNHKGYIQGSAK